MINYYFFTKLLNLNPSHIMYQRNYQSTKLNKTIFNHFIVSDSKLIFLDNSTTFSAYMINSSVKIQS